MTKEQLGQYALMGLVFTVVFYVVSTGVTLGKMGWEKIKRPAPASPSTSAI